MTQPLSPTGWPHICFDERGVAWVDDTNVKVKEIVLDRLAYRSTPEEMHVEYPHLSLAQIHAALGYYYDHKQDLDAELSRDESDIAEMRALSAETPGRRKVRELGLKP